MPLPPSPIGFDTTVFINFCAVGRLDLLVSTVLLVDVLNEIEQLACRRDVEAEVQRGNFQLAEVTGTMELEHWARYTLRLDAGESATLTAAVTRGWSVAMDDRAARRVAESELGANRLTGTIGILRAAIDGGLLTLEQANALLQAMIAAGYWSPIPSLGESEPA